MQEMTISKKTKTRTVSGTSQKYTVYVAKVPYKHTMHVKVSAQDGVKYNDVPDFCNGNLGNILEARRKEIRGCSRYGSRVCEERSQVDCSDHEDCEKENSKVIRMIEAAITAIAAMLAWFFKKKIKRLEDEKAEYKDALCEIDLAISVGDEDRVNRRLESVLRELPKPKGGRNPS